MTRWLLFVLLGACTDSSDANAHDAAAGDAGVQQRFSFTAESGIRIDFAANAKIGHNTNSALGEVGYFLYHQAKEENSGGAGGGHAGNRVSFSENGIDFEESVEVETETGHGCEGDAAATKFFAHPEQVTTNDGTVRMYTLAQRSGVFDAFTSRVSTDGIWFCDSAASVYGLAEVDHGTMGVYHAFRAELDDDQIVLLYLGDLMGSNNVRRAISDGAGSVFSFAASNVLMDEGQPPTVDISTVNLDGDGSRRLFGMRNAVELTSYVTSDDGATWVGPEVILTLDDFQGALEGSEAVCGLFDPTVTDYIDENGVNRYRLYLTAAIWDAAASTEGGTPCSTWEPCSRDRAGMDCIVREAIVSAVSTPI